MLLPVYTIVALINIFAKSHNFNINPPKNLPYEIRVRRDLINTSKHAEHIIDVKNEKAMNKLEDTEEILRENISKDNGLHVIITDTELKRNLDYVVPGDTKHRYDYLNKNALKTKGEGVNEEVKTLNNRGTGNVSLRFKSNKNSDAVNLNTIVVSAENKRENVIAFELIETLKDKTTKPYKSLINYPKTVKNHYLNIEEADNRKKRNFGSDSYNQNNYNYNNQNAYSDNYNQNMNNDLVQNNALNYRVTEKSTFSRAFDWVKSLVNTHEKYIITNDSSSYRANDLYSAPYTGYDSNKNITHPPYYNGNTNNTFYSDSQNSYTGTSSYSGYNYSNQQYPNYGNSNYPTSNNNVHTYTTPAAVSPSNNKTNYNGNHQQFPYNGYRKYAPLHTYNEFNIKTNYTGNSNTGKFNDRYTGINGIGYNYTTYNNTGFVTDNGYGYNPYPVYNATQTNNDTTTDNITVVETCVLCASFGCPKFTRWVGFRCIPIRH